MLQCSSGKPRDLAFTWMSQHPLLKAKATAWLPWLQRDKVSPAGQSVGQRAKKKGSGPTSTTTAKATQPLNSPSKLEK